MYLNWHRQAKTVIKYELMSSETREVYKTMNINACPINNNSL